MEYFQIPTYYNYSVFFVYSCFCVYFGKAAAAFLDSSFCFCLLHGKRLILLELVENIPELFVKNKDLLKTESQLLAA